MHTNVCTMYMYIHTYICLLACLFVSLGGRTADAIVSEALKVAQNVAMGRMGKKASLTLFLFAACKVIKYVHVRISCPRNKSACAHIHIPYVYVCVYVRRYVCGA